jgi:hypothetical protein
MKGKYVRDADDDEDKGTYDGTPERLRTIEDCDKCHAPAQQALMRETSARPADGSLNVGVQKELLRALAPFLTGLLHHAVRAYAGVPEDEVGRVMVALQGLIITRIRAARDALSRGESAEAELDVLAHVAGNWSAQPGYPAAELDAYAASRK